MDTATTVPNPGQAPSGASAKPEPPHVAALREAIDSTFRSRAAFARRLKEQVGSRHKITSSHISMWLRRGIGVPSYLAPDVEAITGMPVEKLCPNVSWHIVRGAQAPKWRGRGALPAR